MEEFRVLQVFSNPVITDVILKYLSFGELLNFSLVSKICCYRGREQLRAASRNSKITLHEVELGTDVCRFLEGLNELLKTSLSVPFAGFCTGRFVWPRYQCSENCVLKAAEKKCSPRGSIDRQRIISSAFSVLLDKIEYKFLRLGPQRDYCEGVRLFLEEILCRKSSEILRIEFAFSSNPNKKRIRQRIPKWTPVSVREAYGITADNYSYWPLLDSKGKPKYCFTHLKTFEVGRNHLQRSIGAELVRGMMLSAPNVRSINGYCFLDEPKYVQSYPAEKVGKVVELDMDYSQECAHQIINTKPKLKSLALHNFGKATIDGEARISFLSSFEKSIRTLFCSSYATLKSLSCSSYILVILTEHCSKSYSLQDNNQRACLGLPNLTTLNLRSLCCCKVPHYPYREGTFEEWTNLKLINYSCFCPRLLQVELGDFEIYAPIHFGNDPHSLFVSQARKVIESRDAVIDLRFKCLSVKTIKLYDYQDWWSLDLVSNIFFNAQEVWVTRAKSMGKVLESDLDLLSTIHVHSWDEDCQVFQHVFGYSKEELEELESEQSGNEFWEQVNIFPSSYSVFNTRVKKLVVSMVSVPQVLITYGLCHMISSRLSGFTLVINDYKKPTLTSSREFILKFAEVKKKLISYPPGPGDAPLYFFDQEFWQYSIVFKR